MNNYAVVNAATGIVENIVVWDGAEEWAPDDGRLVVLGAEAIIGGSYLDGVFSPPPPPVESPEDILAKNSRYQAYVLASTSQAMTPFLLSLQLENATEDEIAKARDLQDYYRQVQLVDLSLANPEWPASPVG